MTCREVSRRVSAAGVETAPFGQRLGVWMHIAMCRPCRLFRRQWERLRLKAKDAGDEAAARRRLLPTRAADVDRHADDVVGMNPTGR